MSYAGVGRCVSMGKLLWMYPTIEKVLRMSGLEAGQNVVVYSDTNRSKEITDAFFLAALNLGTNALSIIETPRTGGPGERSRWPSLLAIEVMKKADFIIDLPTNHWCLTPPYTEIMEGGTKILLSDSDEELIVRLAPTEETIKMTIVGADKITNAKSVRIVSKAGTDVSMSVEGRICNAQTGIISGNRRWDNFPSSLTEVAPLEDSANGTLVIAPGDPIVEFNRLAMDAIKCTLKNGRIVKIEGGVDARLFEEWYAEWDDPNAYVTAHTGFGTHPNAELFSNNAMDWESLYGGINFAFGANKAFMFNGQNASKTHMDIILRNVDFYADNELLVKEGKLVKEALR